MSERKQPCADAEHESGRTTQDRSERKRGFRQFINRKTTKLAKILSLHTRSQESPQSMVSEGHETRESLLPPNKAIDEHNTVTKLLPEHSCVAGSCPKGGSPLELLPNELLHQIWFQSLSLELPWVSSALSRKLADPVTKKLFLRSWVVRMPFGVYIKGKRVEKSFGCDLPLLQYLVNSPFFSESLYTSIRESAYERFGVMRDDFESCVFLQLPRSLQIPLRVLEDTIKANKYFGLYQNLLNDGASPQPLDKATPLLLKGISAGHSETMQPFFSWIYRAGRFVPPSVLEEVLANPQKTTGHMRCVRYAISASIDNEYPPRHPPIRKKFHPDFTRATFTEERYPHLWRWLKINFRVNIYHSLPGYWTSSIRDFELACDGLQADGEQIAQFLDFWS
ncbi:hypothetical protein NA57DRAFT_51537 [Rhizodiscina lignyota]|uniref:Uncharacterized protein n=1 Tax=Rhizodiscina lignyota TaxID=1504668 RepID=A0A9P4IUW4_9PEZI|nr:hypothetical protein NA57DRAFT_51537 [Rhizodiscina lignyota]